jgi:Na+-translocating ferredoxin:NAD+ oxidoreductase subunit G
MTEMDSTNSCPNSGANAAPAPVAPSSGLKARIEARLEELRPKIEYQGASLGAICALVAFLLLVGNSLTKGQIEQEQLADRLVVLRQVLPAELYDNNPLVDAMKIKDETLGEVEVYPARKAGKLTAIVFRVSNIGYAGPIDQLIALNSNGQILGTRILAHKETPGLADKIEISRSDWITVFNGLSLENTPMKDWAVKKDGGRFDQFAGATITPRAIVKSVVQALQFQARQAKQLSEEVKP